MRRCLPSIAVAVAGAMVASCARDQPPPAASAPTRSPAPARRAEPNPIRNAYFGDLHVHTGFSTDAFMVAVRATPDDAYRYAKGEEIAHAGGSAVKLAGPPLDFMAVTDHGERLGVRALAGRGEEEESESLHRDAWQEVQAAADRHYAPGEFTTFIGYEYSSIPAGRNLHRNVIFRDRGAELPFTRDHSRNPEDLWAWLEARRADGIEAIAIPHNSNASNGLMFARATFAGEPFDSDYAELRMRNEPLVEVTQSKGTSETHPALSPNDEWATFELIPFHIGSSVPSEPVGSYARDAWRSGLEIESSGGTNPFKFGIVGSSDSHNGAGSYDESRYFGGIGRKDDTAAERGSVPLAGEGDQARYRDSRFRRWSSGGLAGVWAEENTRESIYAALRRKETFATSGPRIRVRFFAAYGLPADLLDDVAAVEKAYAAGVPMGGDLVGQPGARPLLFVWAARDPESAPLQRLQVVKGWLVDGEARERVYDVACSDGLAPDGATHRCPDHGASVDLTDCSPSRDRGAAELRALWSDPEPAPGARAFYYARVLENPTCRWSTWDAVRAGVAPRPDLPATIQERAWTSPIWYVP